MMYVLLIVAALLFAVQFIFQQRYQNDNGTGIDATLLFQIHTALVMVLLMLILNRFQIQLTLFSVALGFIYAIDVILFIFSSMKAFSIANLSVYSIFAMLGGMIVPFVYGTAFCDEGISGAKILSCVLIAISLMLTFEKERQSKKAMLVYLAVFVFNGLMGVISKIHQSNTQMCTDSRSFMAITYSFIFVLSLGWYLLRNKRIKVLSGKELVYSGSYALCSGIAELCCLIALTVLPASVQYPIVTGGTILFSTIVSMITSKKISIKEMLSALIALIATCAIIL